MTEPRTEADVERIWEQVKRLLRVTRDRDVEPAVAKLLADLADYERRLALIDGANRLVIRSEDGTTVEVDVT